MWNLRREQAQMKKPIDWNADDGSVEPSLLKQPQTSDTNQVKATRFHRA